MPKGDYHGTLDNYSLDGYVSVQDVLNRLDI
jgi:hypothetical protein